MKKNLYIFIEHIIYSIEKIEEFTRNVSENEFDKNIQLQDAVVRRIEIIGEAAKNLPRDFTAKYQDIPWKEIIRTRDKIIHHYFGVNLDIVWNIIKISLPDLKKKLEKIKIDE